MSNSKLQYIALRSKIQNSKFTNGFTLIELLVVITILGLLSTVGLSTFRLSQIKSRDARRKSDLEQVQRALEMYFNDYSRYPVGSSGDINGFAWGNDMVDSNETVYMKELPTDPTGNPGYCYNSDANGTTYQIYARLENSQDPRIGAYTCNQASYNFGVASPNSEP